MKKTLRLVGLIACFVLAAGCGQKGESEAEGQPKGATGAKVALDFHIMSKCPFGVKVVQAVAPVLDKMGDRIDLSIHYIGRETNGELTSMHGEPEVKGDIIQLCAKEIGDNNEWLTFLKCQFEDWRKIPEGWETCAKKANLDAAKMKSCFEGEQGKGLLKASFKKSDEKKATGSPTIFLADQSYSGGRTEASFARAICGAMAEPKAPYCSQIPVPAKVSVTVVGDKRCVGRSCDAKRFLAFVGQTFEGAEIKELDYSDADGKALYEKTKQKFLPIAVFGPEVEKEEAGYSRLKRRLEKLEGTDGFVYPLGREWDPTAEVCDDGVDNTGDGKVDCDDDTCKANKVCRLETKNKLDIFSMSQCPYGVRTVDAMEEVLKAFNNDPAKMSFEINFIGQEQDGKLSSMHGQGEVDEDLRQLCAQKLYPKKNKFMEYVLCRNKDYRNPAWEPCAKNGIQAAALKKCAEGEDGKALLSASFKKAADLGIGGSPSWLLNNKFDMSGRDPNTIKTQFCEKNQGTAGCDSALSTDTNAPPAGSCGAAPAPALQAKPGQPPAAGQPAAVAPVQPAASTRPAVAPPVQPIAPPRRPVN